MSEPPVTAALPPPRPFRYEEIARDLRERIARGDYAASGRLPAERALMQEFGVQRDTVRRALEVLEAERRIFRDTTRGTFVSPGAGAGGADGAAPTPAPTRSVLLAVRRGGDAGGPSALMRGLSDALGREGYPVLWHDTRADTGPGADGTGGAREGQFPPLEILAARGVGGAVVWPEMPAPLARLRSLRAAMPLVVVDRRVPEFESDFVGFADEAGGRVVTEHLLSLGHRRIGFVSGEPQAESVRARERGWESALGAAGVPPPPGWALHAETGLRNLPAAVLDAYLSGGEAPPTALVCANDTVAARMIAHLRARGIRVPEDVAVTGFGDLSPGVLDAFGITTVAQDFEGVGRMAGEMLLARLRERDRGVAEPAPPREVVLPMRLTVRESCGARRC